ncbi:MAG: D-glycerate dehydrogenase [Gemmataceae bacterium]|nr:D-glycerate dehydrogenase [Gemmataceae bacterium]MDW8263838.1 D-glycerate dehydrogenase [Gemmataceae bacterium]
MVGKPKVFVTRVIPEAGLALIREACEADVWSGELPPPEAVLRAKVADCDGLVSLLTDRIDAALLDAAPRLKVVSNFAVGFNNIDVAAATARGICVGNTPGVLTDATADMAFCLLIAAARRVVEGHLHVQAGRWKTWEPLGHLGQDLVGRTLGIVGMGRIGLAMARRCRGGWGMRVLYHDRIRNEQAERELEAQLVDLDTLLREADFVSLHADLNEQTRGIINAAALRKMKPTAILINTARGPLVDQKALTEALQTGIIFAAGLDVTDPEPPDPDDPLLRLPNVVIAPHIASATVRTRNAMAEICARNLLAGLRGEPLPAWVNPEVAGRRR